MKKSICLAICNFFIFAVSAQQVRQAVIASDIRNIRKVTNLELSPDGRFVVYAVQGIGQDPTKAVEIGAGKYNLKSVFICYNIYV